MQFSLVAILRIIIPFVANNEMYTSRIILCIVLFWLRLNFSWESRTFNWNQKKKKRKFEMEKCGNEKKVRQRRKKRKNTQTHVASLEMVGESSTREHTNNECNMRMKWKFRRGIFPKCNWYFCFYIHYVHEATTMTLVWLNRRIAPTFVTHVNPIHTGWYQVCFFHAFHNCQ